jgi:hypothetical protein
LAIAKHIRKRALPKLKIIKSVEIQNLSDLMQSVPGGGLLESQSLEGLFAKYWEASNPDSFQLTT